VKTSAKSAPSVEELSDDDLIRQWRNQKKVAAKEELRRRHRGLIESAIIKYQGAAVPRIALELETYRLFDEAIQDYKIGSSAKFSTFASMYLYRLDRYTKQHQNVARIPEGLAASIGKYDRATFQLKEELQREPTHKEIGRRIGLSAKRVQTLEQSRRRDLFEGGFEGESFDMQGKTTANQHVLEDMRPLLNPQELQIYDLIIGYKLREAVTDNREIARRLKLSPGRVSQIKGDIARKIGPEIQKRLK
jgi:DNA-directed RNA polymerase sigma subunit (sigma70/sigma32)